MKSHLQNRAADRTTSRVKSEQTNTVKDEEWTWTIKDVKWDLVAIIVLSHIIGIPGFVLMHYEALLLQNLRLFFWTYFVMFCSMLGITAGVHRYFSHRSYEMKTPLKIVLLMMYYGCGQISVKQWVRNHRVHHKFSETDADPHNIKRGFFFAHFGWVILPKHPEVLRKGKMIDISDIENDPCVAIFDRYPLLSKVLFCFAIPILVPVYAWGEDLLLTVLYIFGKYVVVMNLSCSINSFAHVYGYKSYDRNIASSENLFLSIITFGESWHNYHHTFPYDYRTGEADRINFTAKFIDFSAKMGWAYNLKMPSKSLVEMTIAKRGDGTHEKAEELAEKFKVGEEFECDPDDRDK